MKRWCIKVPDRVGFDITTARTGFNSFPERVGLDILSERVGKQDPHKPEPARLVRIDPMVEDHWLFQFRFVEERLNREFSYRPGQFVMLSVIGVGEAPISISSSPTRPGMIELCVRRTGRVTDALYRLKENDLVGIRGPYGNGFNVDKLKGNDLLIIAGGLGMAPLRSLVWYVLDNRKDFGDINLMYGARTSGDLLFKNEIDLLLNRKDIKCLLIVERVQYEHRVNWRGHTGLITDLFKHVEVNPKSTYAAICGPPVMYKFVLQKLLELEFSKDRILMSLERKMKCGIGKCAHCTIGYKYTCIHGPIFTYWDAMNLPEMI